MLTSAEKKICRFGNIELTPSAGILNYGQVRNFNLTVFQARSRSHASIWLNPSDHIWNLEQGIIEGVKAYRGEDGGIFLFRPNENAIRMQIGAERMCMPCPSVDQFMIAVQQTALANRRWVKSISQFINPVINCVWICCLIVLTVEFFSQIPPSGKGALYIRPLLMGSGPASEYTFLVYASPVGNYFEVA